MRLYQVYVARYGLTYPARLLWLWERGTRPDLGSGILLLTAALHGHLWGRTQDAQGGQNRAEGKRSPRDTLYDLHKKVSPSIDSSFPSIVVLLPHTYPCRQDNIPYKYLNDKYLNVRAEARFERDLHMQVMRSAHHLHV
jgi:hypothetical protein